MVTASISPRAQDPIQARRRGAAGRMEPVAWIRGKAKKGMVLRHIYVIICRRDSAKFKYLMRWLAWCVQNPDKHPETVIILKSRKQGTGKSTLGIVMTMIFGKYHAAIVDDKDRLIGRFAVPPVRPTTATATNFRKVRTPMVAVKPIARNIADRAARSCRTH